MICPGLRECEAQKAGEEVSLVLRCINNAALTGLWRGFKFAIVKWGSALGSLSHYNRLSMSSGVIPTEPTIHSVIKELILENMP